MKLKLSSKVKVGSQPCRSVSQGVGLASCLPKTAWPPTSSEQVIELAKPLIKNGYGKYLMDIVEEFKLEKSKNEIEVKQ